jgi:hypothetical protein
MDLLFSNDITSWRGFAKEVRSKQLKLLVNLENFPNSILVTGCQRSGGTILAQVITHLRNSIWYFLTGKVVSAVMTFFILFWVVRLLTLEEYGVYITLVPGMELVIAISGLGLPWLAARYLPEYRLHASGSLIQRLAWGLLL